MLRGAHLHAHGPHAILKKNVLAGRRFTLCGPQYADPCSSIRYVKSTLYPHLEQEQGFLFCLCFLCFMHCIAKKVNNIQGNILITKCNRHQLYIDWLGLVKLLLNMIIKNGHFKEYERSDETPV